MGRGRLTTWGTMAGDLPIEGERGLGDESCGWEGTVACASGVECTVQGVGSHVGMRCGGGGWLPWQARRREERRGVCDR